MSTIGIVLSPVTAFAIKPVRTEIVSPIRVTSFNKDGKAKERKQGGNP